MLRIEELYIILTESNRNSFKKKKKPQEELQGIIKLLIQSEQQSGEKILNFSLKKYAIRLCRVAIPKNFLRNREEITVTEDFNFLLLGFNT